ATRITRRIALLLMLLSAAGSAHGQPAGIDSSSPNTPTVDILVAGNEQPSIILHVPNNTGGLRYFKYHFFGAGYTWQPNHVIPDSAGSATGRTENIEGLSGGSVAILLTTTGMAMTGAAGSSTQYVEFTFCSVPLNELCETTPSRYRFVVDPLLSNATAEITTNTTTPVTVELSSVTVNAVIAATCAQRNGATITASPATRNTDSQGKAAFTITTNNLVKIAPSGTAPEGECVFNTVAGSHTTKVDVRGTLISPSIALSPQTPVQVPNSGSTTIDQTVVVSTSSPVTAGATIDASCIANNSAAVSLENGPPAVSATASKITVANGTASFQVKATKLVALVPAGTPSVQCQFNIHNFSTIATYNAVGKQINPSVALNSTLIQVPGVSSLTATMSPAYPGFTITPSCTISNLPAISVVPTTTPTDTQGRQVFQVSAPQLVIVNPSVATLPSAFCTFKVTGANNIAVLNFSTGNVCAFTPGVSSPRPAQCGDPVN
ncbi:MAG: hypothetical protein ABI411_16455, partial [Tahibacter sp.]